MTPYRQGIEDYAAGRPLQIAIRQGRPMIRRRFYKLERRVFCPCELCRLPFGRMLYNRMRSGEPLRSYLPGGQR